MHKLKHVMLLMNQTGELPITVSLNYTTHCSLLITTGLGFWGPTAWSSCDEHPQPIAPTDILSHP